MIMRRFLQVIAFTLCSIAVPLADAFSVAGPTPATSTDVVVYGTASNRDFVLLGSKLAAEANLQVKVICGEGTESGCRRLMYGVDYADAGKDEEGWAVPISAAESIAEALGDASSLILCGHDEALDESMISTLFNYVGPNLSKVVLISKIGISKAGRGGFFGGGSDSKLLETETMLKSKLKERDNTKLHIIRAGICKGGGPGNGDHGLDKCYYNTLLDVVEATMTMSHDKFTLGADITPGDSISMPNIMEKMGTKASFDPRPYDSSRIVVAKTAVASLFLDDVSIDCSVSTARGESPPSLEKLKEMLSKISTGKLVAS